MTLGKLHIDKAVQGFVVTDGEATIHPWIPEWEWKWMYPLFLGLSVIAIPIHHMELDFEPDIVDDDPME